MSTSCLLLPSKINVLIILKSSSEGPDPSWTSHFFWHISEGFPRRHEGALLGGGGILLEVTVRSAGRRPDMPTYGHQTDEFLQGQTSAPIQSLVRGRRSPFFHFHTDVLQLVNSCDIYQVLRVARNFVRCLPAVRSLRPGFRKHSLSFSEATKPEV